MFTNSFCYKTRVGNQSQSNSGPLRWHPQFLRWPPVVHGWLTGRNILCCMQKIVKIVMRTCNLFVDSPAVTSELSALIFCLIGLSYICFAALPTSRLVHSRCKNSLKCCRCKFVNMQIPSGFHNEMMTIKKSTFPMFFHKIIIQCFETNSALFCFPPTFKIFKKKFFSKKLIR